MSQTAYTIDQDALLQGQKLDSRFDHVESLSAAIPFDFGLAVVKAANDESARPPQLNNVVITEDAGTFTAGTIVVTVQNVTAGTTDVVSEVFATSKAVTMTALAASIQALASVSTGVSAPPLLTIVAANDVALIVTVDVTGITGTMTITSIVGTTNDTLVRGFGIHQQMRNRNLPANFASSTVSGYVLKDQISTLVQGAIAAVASGAIAIDSATLFIDTTSGNEGKVTTTSSGNIAIPTARARSASSANGDLIKIEINIP